MSHRPLCLLPLTVLGLLLNLCPAWAQDFDKLDDRLTLAGGLPNRRPKDPARLEIGKAWGKVLDL